MTEESWGKKIRIGRGEWWAIASAISYSLGNVTTRVVSVEGNPIAGTILRTLPITLVSLGFMGFRPKNLEQYMPQNVEFMGWRPLSLLLIYSLVITPVSMISLYLAFRYGGVLVAVPVFAVNPLWAAMIAVPFLGEAFNKRIVGGIISTMIGIALITYGQHVGTPVSSQWPLGVVFALLTALTWALGANCRRYLFKQGLDIFWVVAITTGTGIMVLLVILAGQGNLDTILEYSANEFGQLFLAGTLSAAGNIALSAAFLSITVASGTTLKNLDVVIASIVAILFLDETLNLPVGLGIALIVAGVIAVQMGRDRAIEVAP